MLAPIRSHQPKAGPALDDTAAPGATLSL
jgi:hypothetical protein